MGRQVYIVYPLIEESETLDLKNLEDGYLHIQEAFPEFIVGKMHGRMKSSEKENVMERFASGQTQILVSTTVIEVGVNVPNATVMVIESAQRFGLSQLHQLRGRVGRGADQSYCVLLTPYELSSVTRKRIEIMTGSNDGFLIAEADLKLRGPGDIEGTQQSGIPFNLKIADIVKDNEILYFAREIAEKLIESDPELVKSDHAILKQQLSQLSGNRYDWSRIS